MADDTSVGSRRRRTSVNTGAAACNRVVAENQASAQPQAVELIRSPTTDTTRPRRSAPACRVRHLTARCFGSGPWGTAGVVPRRPRRPGMGQYIDVGDVSVWYTDEGNGESLLLLHGGLCTNETWAAQMPALARHFHVIAAERRGHGHTADVAGPLTYTAMAADMVGLLDRVVGRPAHLVGHSDGGSVVVIIAIPRPDLVAKLVAISANTDPSGVVPELYEMFERASPDGAEMATLRGPYERYSPDGPEHWP